MEDKKRKDKGKDGKEVGGMKPKCRKGKEEEGR